MEPIEPPRLATASFADEKTPLLSSAYVPQVHNEARKGILTNGRTVKLLEAELLSQKMVFKHAIETARDRWLPYADVRLPAADQPADCGCGYYVNGWDNWTLCCSPALWFSDPNSKTRTLEDGRMQRETHNMAICIPTRAVVEGGSSAACLWTAVKVCGLFGCGCTSSWTVAAMVVGLTFTPCIADCAIGGFEDCCLRWDQSRHVSKYKPVRNAVTQLINDLTACDAMSPLKIDRFVKRLQGLELTETTRLAVISEMSLVQVHKLRTLMGERVFTLFENKYLSEQKKVALQVLDAQDGIQSLEEIHKALCQLVSYMQQDQALWEAIVVKLSDAAVRQPNIKLVLKLAGRSFYSSHIALEDGIEELRRQAKAMVSCIVKVNNEVWNSYELPTKVLIPENNADGLFKRAFSSRLREQAQKTIELTLEEDEAHAFPYIVEYLKTERIEPSHVFAMLRLANRLGLTLCANDCHWHIIERAKEVRLTPEEIDILLSCSPGREAANTELLRELFATFIRTHDLGALREYVAYASKYQLIEILGHFQWALSVKIKVTEWCFSKPWLRFIFEFELLHQAQTAAKDAILQEISQYPNNLQYITLCEDLPKLLPHVIRQYALGINWTNFYKLEEYAEKHDSRELKMALRDFMESHVDRLHFTDIWTRAVNTRYEGIKDACKHFLLQPLPPTEFDEIMNFAESCGDVVLEDACRRHLENHITVERFFYIWSVAANAQDQILKTKCMQFLQNHSNISDILCQWPPAKEPDELDDVMARLSIQ